MRVLEFCTIVEGEIVRRSQSLLHVVDVWLMECCRLNGNAVDRSVEEYNSAIIQTIHDLLGSELFRARKSRIA